MSGSATVSGERVARVAGTARAALEARAGEVDDLNVFPVADGDTGTNMLLTAVAVEEAAAATTGLPRAERCGTLARAALMGARGNSGMILSQLVRGAADALAGQEGPLDGAGVAAALRRASAAADAAVRRPVEGTMLTVARAAAEAAEAAGAGGAQEVLAAALAGGREAVERTPGQLDVLREAGVVDAGGLGLVLLLEGVAAGLAGRAVAAPMRVAPAAPRGAGHAPSRYRYCTSFLVEGEAIDLAAVGAALEAIGDSVLVMGDPAQAKVHVHTDAPERAEGIARAWGEVGGLVVEDMRRQEAERDARLRAGAPATAACGALALLPGAGARALAEGLGARALAAGARPADIAGAVAGIGAPEAVIVTSGPEGVAAAEDAAGEAVPVVETASAAAALACLVAFDPSRGAADNAAEMAALAAGVATARVDGAGAGELRGGLARALDGLLDDGPCLVTVLIGADAGVEPHEVEAWVREAAGAAGVEVEAHEGGQARPALAIAVE
jgi:DAK2 domain fusion protein YloV